MTTKHFSIHALHLAKDVVCTNPLVRKQTLSASCISFFDYGAATSQEV